MRADNGSTGLGKVNTGPIAFLYSFFFVFFPLCSLNRDEHRRLNRESVARVPYYFTTDSFLIPKSKGDLSLSNLSQKATSIFEKY